MAVAVKVKLFLRIFGLGILLLLLVGFFWAAREGTRMYGGLAELADHTLFEVATEQVAIVNAQVLSEDGSVFFPDQTILIDGKRIAAVGAQLDIPDSFRQIDAQGNFVIPGLIDAHVHLWQSPNDLLLYLANGVTHIRELIGTEAHLQWREEIEQGRAGPELFVASPRLGSFEALEGAVMKQTQWFANIPNAESANSQVQAFYDQGYDGLKIYSQLNKDSYLAIAQKANELGMPFFGHIPFDVAMEDIYASGQSSIAHFEEIMNALQRTFGDYSGGGIQDAFGSFKGREQEFLAFVEQEAPTIARKLASNSISVSTTLWLTQSFVRQKRDVHAVLADVALPYENPGIAEGSPIAPRALAWLPGVNRYRHPAAFDTEEKRMASEVYWQAYGDACVLIAKIFFENGVKLLAGTDTNLPPAVPGFALHDELQSLAAAGLPNDEVLRSASINPAKWLKKDTGTIKPGYEADLLLLSANPLEDIANTEKILTVISNGSVYSRAMLDQMLAAVQRANDTSRSQAIDDFL